MCLFLSLKIKIFHHKYSIFLSKFQKVSPACTKHGKKLCEPQKNEKNKNKNKQTKGEEIYINGLLTNFIHRVNIIVPRSI